MADSVHAPNIHLFAFHLWKSFTPDAIPFQQDTELLWQKCNEIFNKFEISQQLFVRNDNPSGYRVDWLKDAIDKSKVLTPKLSGKTPKNLEYPEQSQLDVTCVVYPLRIGDSYALALNIRCPQQLGNDIVHIARLKDFNPAQCFLPSFIESNLGQTLVITAFLTEEQKQQDKNWLTKLADKCVQNFIGEKNNVKIPLCYQAGELFGSPIFEYGLPGEPHDYGHILVWLFFSEETSIKFGRDSYKKLPDLFLYRNKIIKAYQDSHKDYEIAILKSKEIEASIRELKEIPEDTTLDKKTLDNLNTKIKKLLQLNLEYSQLLRNIEFYRNSIKINNNNYIEKIKQISTNLPNDDLTFLEGFSKTNASHFQEQIQADLDYLVHTSTLLDNAIATIRGIVEINQAKRNEQQEERDKERDRDFQITAFAIGAGLSVGGIVISASSQVPSQNNSPLLLPWSKNASIVPHPFILWVFGSIASGIVAAYLAWQLTKWWQKRTND
ncbi:hypothetical protein SAMD00079811_20880 [Scytonema sp. HK-05]|uniref:hypothetical protein n=1 Tax=Scytonema sp. HK-05 TaxID=1137095 RepID=UPI000936E82A|nr:hypothetical protein [Scytonema sp. HK-05]OKH53170.1 hypothetical protein NIES2130_30840 [Scytonema sp. HK-05]BAY44488.1 hypothetical protein SAMD00079811_20880 [Scytonema sp. HK-05]